MKENTKRQILHLWLPVVVAFALGLALIVYSQWIDGHREVLRGTILELGIGFFVAGVIAITIEWYMRSLKEAEDKERDRRLQENVFRELFGTALPPNLVNEMYELLFTRKFMRQELTVAFDLRPLNDVEKAQSQRPDLLLLTQKVTYHAKNISDAAANHHVTPQECLLVKSPAFTQPFKSYTASISGSKPINLSKSAIGSSVAENGMWYKLKLPVLEKVPPNAVVEVESVTEVLCRDTDARAWLTYHPAEKLTVTATLHDDLVDAIEFTVDKSHRGDLIPGKGADMRKLYGWTIENPILPYQGIILYWRRKSTGHAQPQHMASSQS